MASKMSNLFTTFLLMIIGLALAPNVQEMVSGITGVGGTNMTGSAESTGISPSARNVVSGSYSVVLDYHRAGRGNRRDIRPVQGNRSVTPRLCCVSDRSPYFF